MNPLAARLFNTPAALHPAHADLAITALADWFAGASAGGMSALAEFASTDKAETETPRPYQVVSGVAIIPVKGTLMQRVGMMPLWCCSMLGIAGYDILRVCILHALSDSDIDAIVLDVDSPGGEVAGMLDLSDMIYRARGVKPIWAILGENAFSAAYCIASAASYITVPRTGGTGSVGVIYMHVSFEEALKKAGVEVTLITKGDLKGDGSDMQNLSPGAFKRMKADILTVGDMFDATVARNRKIKVSQVFDTQAGTFLGAAGVDVGFADAVMSPDQAFRALLKQLG
jgi:signal peptide peptidase SppA